MQDFLRQKVADALSTAPPPFTRRDVHVPQVPGRAVAVIGPRRAGKTTFLWQLFADRLAAGTPRAGLLYLNFEDERLLGARATDLDAVVDEFYALSPGWRDRRRATWFLDEIQMVPEWERFARRVLDNERLDLFLSGSSAKLLSREVATSMRGRAVEALVYPFSFREYLRHLGREPRALRGLPKADRSHLEGALRDYLVVGGFPEAVGLGPRDRSALLGQLVDLSLFRDVVERHNVSQPLALRAMTRHLLANAAGPFSVNRFYKDLQSQHIAAAKATLHGYLAALEDAFIVRAVPVATGSERRRIVNPRKVYPIDPGLIPVFDRSGRANRGHALETAVLLELDRRGAEVAYVRTPGGLEVDFFARFPEGGEALIQVCASVEGEALSRDLDALEAARAQHPRASRHLVYMGGPPADLPPGVTARSAVQWLLGAQ